MLEITIIFFASLSKTCLKLNEKVLEIKKN